MNSIMERYYPVFEQYQALRRQLLAIVDDNDLRFTPGGENPTLGALCREIGEVQHAYIESFKTFQQDFAYRHPDPEIAYSAAGLQSWYAELDAELKRVIENLTEEDLKERLVDRGPDFKISPRIQLDIYKEALLIFYGKVSVYLKAMERERPEQWQHWIA